MSIIASTYNTGTGLSSSVAEEQLPVVVNDLTINGNLTVIESTILNGPTTITTDLIVGQTTTTDNIIVNNNIIIDNGVGQNNTSIFKLPLTNGTTDQILTISDDTTNPILTEWKDAPVNDYVQFNTTTKKLSKVDLSGTSEISNLVLGGVGQNTGALLKLPLNNGIDGQVLTILNDAVTPMTTSWQTPVNDYVQFNTATNKLSKIDFSGTAEINNLVLSNSIGLSTSQKFILPLNTSSASLNSVLTLTNTGSKKTSWEPLVQITDYVNYNSTNTSLISNVSGTPTIISDIELTTIGRSGQKFNLPSNTSSTTPLSGTYFLTINNTTKNSSWVVPFGNMNYDNSSYVLSSEIAGEGILPITEIQMTTIGRLNQKFNLPSNTSTALNGSLLSIDSTTKDTTWQSDYLKYNTSTTQITNNVTGTAVAITDLRLTRTGQSGQKFDLPSNTSTAPLNSVLTLSNTTNKTTTWTTISNVTNYTNYNSTNKTLISNVNGTPTTVSDLVMSGSIGLSTPQKFILPSNTSTAPLNSFLSLTNTSTKATTWVSPTSLINNYVNYNLLNNKLASVISGTASDITTVVIDNIGKESQTFVLPSNTSTAPLNSVLTLSNTTNKTTTWTTISNVTNYTNYNSTNKTLISNVNGTPTTVSDLVMSGSIGLSTPQKFILPSNTSTAPLNSFLSLTNTSTKATTWVSPTSLINNYVNYNLLNNKLASVISGTASDITTVVVDNIGKESQTFILPSNTSSTSVNSVLTLTNTSTKTTAWQEIPTQISNFVSYNTSNNKLLNNVNSNINDINQLLVSTVIKTPSIQSTTVNNSLIIGNNQTGSTARIDIGVNSSRKSLINIGTGTTTGDGHTINIGTGILTPININGTTTIADDLVANTSIGKSLIEKFVLPSNTSTAPINSFLSLTNTTNKTTSWVSIPSAITDYISYNTGTFKLINNNGGTVTNINTISTDLVIADTVQTTFGGTVSSTFSDFTFLKVSPTAVQDSTYIGYTYSGSVTSPLNYLSGSTRADDITNIVPLVNGGHYMIKYEITINSGTTSRSLTSITHGLSNSGSTLTTVNGIKYEPQCCTSMKLNTGSEVINSRLYQGTVFFKYNNANAYTIFCVLNFSGSGSVSLDITFTSIRII